MCHAVYPFCFACFHIVSLVTLNLLPHVEHMTMETPGQRRRQLCFASKKADSIQVAADLQNRHWLGPIQCIPALGLVSQDNAYPFDVFKRLAQSSSLIPDICRGAA